MSEQEKMSDTGTIPEAAGDAMTRRERIIAVLAAHPEGLPTPLLGKLVDENRPRAKLNCWEVLRAMEARGEVVRVPSLGRATAWRLTPARLRPMLNAIAKSKAAWESLMVEEWAELGFTEEAWLEFIGHYQALVQRELAAS